MALNKSPTKASVAAKEKVIKNLTGSKALSPQKAAMAKAGVKGRAAMKVSGAPPAKKRQSYVSKQR